MQLAQFALSRPPAILVRRLYACPISFPVQDAVEEGTEDFNLKGFGGG